MSADRRFIEQKVQQMSKDDIIQLPTSSWRAKIVVTQDLNPYRRNWLCVDFPQTINVYTKLDTYPLHKIYDMVNRIGQLFSIFYIWSQKCISSSWHQPGRQYFEANERLYESKRITMGVTNSATKFQRAVDQVVEAKDLEETFSYMDNVMVCGIN